MVPHRYALAQLTEAMIVEAIPQLRLAHQKNLQKLPILVVTSESSFRAVDDHCTVKYLNQAGVHPTWTKLADIGIHGNGHMMMLEKNNMQIAEVMARWLDKVAATGSNKKGTPPAGTSDKD